MGCAVIWSYVELFGTDRLKAAVFVDQVCVCNTAAAAASASSLMMDIPPLTPCTYTLCAAPCLSMLFFSSCMIQVHPRKLLFTNILFTSATHTRVCARAHNPAC